MLLLYALAKNLVHLIFIAVSIRTARLLLLYALAKNIVHFIFIAVSIRTARLLLLYALAKNRAFNFHSCFYKDSKTAIAICFSK
jgi:cytochrome c-type biogenesis protein CcmE